MNVRKYLIVSVSSMFSIICRNSSLYSITSSFCFILSPPLPLFRFCWQPCSVKCFTKFDIVLSVNLPCFQHNLAKIVFHLSGNSFLISLRKLPIKSSSWLLLNTRVAHRYMDFDFTSFRDVRLLSLNLWLHYISIYTNSLLTLFIYLHQYVHKDCIFTPIAVYVILQWGKNKSLFSISIHIKRCCNVRRN